LIDAFKIVLEEIPNARLLVVGGGKDVETVQNLVIELNLEEEVLFVGQVASEEVANYFDLADITVDPVYDNDVARGRCPLKMFESWAMGKPFVTSDVGDRRKLVGNPPAAILTKPGNSKDMAEKIINIFRNKTQEKILKKRGYSRVHQYYWENIVENSFQLIVDD
jgi:glycosyltransferase involved in cell wall biosynthesis